MFSSGNKFRSFFIPAKYFIRFHDFNKSAQNRMGQGFERKNERRKVIPCF
jgi:hypothetical protein